MTNSTTHKPLKGSIGTPTRFIRISKKNHRKRALKRSALRIGKKLGIENPNKYQMNKLKRIARLDNY